MLIYLLLFLFIVLLGYIFIRVFLPIWVLCAMIAAGMGVVFLLVAIFIGY